MTRGIFDSSGVSVIIALLTLHSGTQAVSGELICARFTLGAKEILLGAKRGRGCIGIGVGFAVVETGKSVVASLLVADSTAASLAQLDEGWVVFG